MMKKIFLTGGTGFIGKELVKKLLTQETEVILLVRSVNKAIALFPGCGPSLKFVEGDLTKSGLGLSDKDKQLVLQSGVIIHAGGPMDITVSEELATSAFLNGAKHVGELAKSIHATKGLEHFIHIVGYMSPFDDSNSNIDMDVFQDGHQYLKINNPYERTKFLADLYMRQQAKEAGYPLSVINPPTVVGSTVTGSTEQLGGLGLLVKSMRQGLMPVVPGGKGYRLPLIANDALSEFIVKILNQEHPENGTYTLVSDPQVDVDISELLKIMAKSMNVKAPTKSVSIEIMKTLLNGGGSKLTGIPADGLSFITNRAFRNESVKKAAGTNWFLENSVRNVLPLVIADLDYRITHPDIQEDNRFERARIDNLVVYQKRGEGKPFILLHGLLSDGENLFPLANSLHEKTGLPVWVVDLPGFGRSPFHQAEHVMTAYLLAVKSLLSQTAEGAHFIGHSFGAAVLIEAFKENYFRTHDTITLMQPPFSGMNLPKYPAFIKKWVLKNASLRQLKKYCLDTGMFGSGDQIPEAYLTKVKRSFTSPRVLNTTVKLIEVLSPGLELPNDASGRLQIIWGNQDKAYRLPEKVRNVMEVPYGHHFPLSHPHETADLIVEERLNSLKA